MNIQLPQQQPPQYNLEENSRRRILRIVLNGPLAITIDPQYDEEGYHQMREEDQEIRPKPGRLQFLIDKNSNFNREFRKYTQDICICSFLIKLTVMTVGSGIGIWMALSSQK